MHIISFASKRKEGGKMSLKIAHGKTSDLVLNLRSTVHVIGNARDLGMNFYKVK